MHRGWARAALAVAQRPALWGTAARQSLLLARPRWWRRPPYLPVPDDDYLRFRLQTATGDPSGRIEADDLVTYLHWCRDYPRPRSGARR